MNHISKSPKLITPNLSSSFLKILGLLLLLLFTSPFVIAENVTNSTDQQNQGLFEPLDTTNDNNVSLFIFLTVVVLLSGYFIHPGISFIYGLIAAFVMHNSDVHTLFVLFFFGVTALSAMGLLRED